MWFSPGSRIFCGGRWAFIRLGERCPVFMRRFLVRHLGCCRRNVALLHCCLLLGPWPCLYAAFAAVKAAVVVIVHNHGTVNISVMYNCFINAHYCRIVAKPVVFPAPTVVTMTAIAITIVNAAVKAYAWPPIAGMKTIASAHETPISRRPVQAGIWRGYPHTGNPIVTVGIIVRPVTGLPYIAIGRRLGQIVYAQWRRRRAYRNTYANLCL